MTAAPGAAPTSGRDYLRLVLLGLVIGIPAALLATLFLSAVHELENLLWHSLPAAIGHTSPPWYLVVPLPVVGAAIVLLARRLLPGDGGHPPLKGLSKEAAPLSYLPGVVLAALATLVFGAVLGPEAPVLALGAASGVAISQLAKLEPNATRVMTLAGGFSALSALFGGPIVAGMFLVESSVGLGAALPAILVPGLVSASVGYVIFIGLGHWHGLNPPGLLVPNLPIYSGAHLDGLVIAVVVGVVAALGIGVIHRLGEGIDGLGRHSGLPVLLLGGGLAVGLLAEFASLLGANSQDVLFSGQTSIPAIVTAGTTKIVLVTLVAKALAYGISLGCGFRGGPIFPTIFLGVALMSFPVVWFHTSPTLAIAVGAAAGMAAQTRLLITPALLASLLVGRAGLDTIPAAVLASVAAWLVMAALDARAKAREGSVAAAD